ncbi:MAG: alpha/beta hydrolase-fold protein [Pseudomonadota bacterium]
MPNEATHNGTVIELRFTSRVLRNNALCDPHDRAVPVYLPPGYDAVERRYPVLFDLAAYTSSGPAHLNWQNFGENLPTRLDRLIGSGKMSPCIVVLPDCYTRLGGNQYVNSSAMGRYGDYVSLELVPFIDGSLRTKAAREHRGLFGKSSGGFGALHLAMAYPDVWGAAASHAGDAYFDFVYRSEWPAALTHLQRFAPRRNKRVPAGHDDGRVAAFLRHCQETESPSGTDIMTLMLVCMAASYDPSPRAPLGFALPFDLNDGRLLNQRWNRWLAFDPVTQARSNRKALQRLRALFIDCGRWDQFHIHYGARQLHAELQRLGITHRYEEFDGTHSNINHRLDISLPYLARNLR